MYQLIAKTLSNKGFQTKVFSNGIIVSLSNRNLNSFEVEMALGNEFEGMFSFSRKFDGSVIVK